MKRIVVLGSTGSIGMNCLEVIAEHYIDCPRQKLEELDALLAALPILPHGIWHSFGTDEPLDAHRQFAWTKAQHCRHPFHGRASGHGRKDG